MVNCNCDKLYCKTKKFVFFYTVKPKIVIVLYRSMNPLPLFFFSAFINKNSQKISKRIHVTKKGNQKKYLCYFYNLVFTNSLLIKSA